MMKTRLIALLTTALLAACSDAQYNAPSTPSYAQPAPGTVTVHMNGTAGTAIGVSSTR
jgi:ABC-type glycerol-3-phosphate transport system substrate-binding protein